MLTPILPTPDPYETARQLVECGWHLDFATEPDSADRMAAVSLHDNALLLGSDTEEFVPSEAKPFLGAGLEFHCTVPADALESVHADHAPLVPGPIEVLGWGERGFRVRIARFRFVFVGSDSAAR